MPLTIRITFRTLVVALLAWLFVATPAFAHAGHDHGEPVAGDTNVTFADRAAALTTAARVESARRRAPDAVAGQCLRTVEVPLQGDSCDLGDGMWGVLQPDGSTAQTHGPDIYAASTPQVDLSVADQARLDVAGDLVAHPTDSDYVTCESNPRVPRTVVVFAKPPGVTYTQPQVDAVVLRIRGELRKASEFVRAQAETDRAGDAIQSPVTFRMQCVGSTIDVKVVDIADPQRDQYGDPTFSGIEAAIRATGVVGADDAGRIVAYAPFDVAGVAGQGWVYNDASPGRDNVNNGEDQFAAHYLTGSDATSPIGIDWDIFLHEMLHNMGAVNTNRVAVPDSNGMGHCTSDKDVMCYSEGGVSTSAHAGCGDVQLDCGRDTYFNASDAPTGWIASHWNAGSTNNRYLDFGTRTPADIVAPTRPIGLSVSSPSPNTVVVSWNASSDGSGVDEYDLLYGTSSPTNVVTTSNTGGRLTNLTAGTRTFWVIAYDHARNASAMSAPVTVQVMAAPVATPPAANPSAANPTAIPVTPAIPDPVAPTPTVRTVPAPASPTAVRVTSIRPGIAVLAWTRGAGDPADTTYRVEVRDASSPQWKLAATAGVVTGSTHATVRVRPGAVTLARVVAGTGGGSARSDQIRFATSARGSTCRWVAGDATPPRAPARPRLVARSARTVKVSFRRAADARGVCAIRLLARTSSGPWRVAPRAIAGSANVATFAGLKPRATVQLALEAVDARGNVSRRTILRARTK